MTGRTQKSQKFTEVDGKQCDESCQGHFQEWYPRPAKESGYHVSVNAWVEREG